MPAAFVEEQVAAEMPLVLSELQEHCLHGLALRDADALAALTDMHSASRPPDAEGYAAYTPSTHMRVSQQPWCAREATATRE